jgi:DNA-binding MarR family transcriptional regulator
MSEVRAKTIAGMDDTLGFNLRMAQLRFFAAFYRDFSDAGLTPAEYSILSTLAGAGGLRQGELAARLHIKRSNMTKVMRALEGRGLVRRQTPGDDARAFEVLLTPAGRNLQRHVAARIPGHDRAVAAALTGQERDKLLALLNKLLRTGDAGETSQPAPIKQKELAR